MNGDEIYDPAGAKRLTPHRSPCSASHALGLRASMKLTSLPATRMTVRHQPTQRDTRGA